MSISNSDFVHWHCHSEFSQLDGLAKIDELAYRAREMGFPALALTDHGNIMGWIKFINYCTSTKDSKGNDIDFPPIKPILGTELYLSRKMDIGQYEGNKDKVKKIQPDGRRGNRHITLYATNYEGYKNVCRMSQRAYANGYHYDPRIDFELLEECSNGVMVGSACLGSLINANLLSGKYENARKIGGWFKEVFKENFFLEIMWHGLVPERFLVPEILKLSSDLDVPVLATNDSHYINREDAKAQDVLLCMSQKKCIRDPKRLRFDNNQFYLKSAREMEDIFGDVPHVLTNTKIMADKIDFEDIKRNIFGGMKLPKMEIPSEFKNPYEYLCKLAWDGFKRKGYEGKKSHEDCLKKELRDVAAAWNSNGYDFSTYFLIVRDFINFAKSNKILCGPGRGSGYSSILLRCLDITYGLDPVEYGLIWERFLLFKDAPIVKASQFGLDDDVIDLSVSEIDSDDEEELL